MVGLESPSVLKRAPLNWLGERTMSQKEGWGWFLYTLLCHMGRNSYAKWYRRKQVRNRWLLCRKWCRVGKSWGVLGTG